MSKAQRIDNKIMLNFTAESPVYIDGYPLKLNLSVPHCEGCPYMSGTFTPASVIWQGNDSKTLKEGDVKVVMVGDSPGSAAANLGYSFAGPSGNLLFSSFETLLLQAGYKHLPVCLATNALLCEPTNTVTPTTSKVNACSKLYLKQYLGSRFLAKDAVIVAVGAAALKALWTMQSDKAGGILPDGFTAMKGIPYTLTIDVIDEKTQEETKRTFVVFPIYHPMFIFRQTNRLTEFITDLVKLRSLVYDDADSCLTKPLDDIDYKVYSTSLTGTDLEEIYTLIDKAKIISLDIETTNAELHNPNNKLLMVGIGLSSTKSIHFTGESIIAVKLILKRAKERGILMVNHYIQFDIRGLWVFRIIDSLDELPEYRDTLILQQLLDENAPKTLGNMKLKNLLTKHLGISDYSRELDQYFQEQELKTSGKLKTITKNQKDFSKIPPDVLAKYNARDVCGVIRLYRFLRNRLVKDDSCKAWKIDYVKFMHAMDKELLNISLHGLTYDIRLAIKTGREMSDRLTVIEKTLQADTDLIKAASVSKFIDKTLKNDMLSTLSAYTDWNNMEPDKQRIRFNPGSTEQTLFWLSNALPAQVKERLLRFLGKEARTATNRLSLKEGNVKEICTFLAKPQFRKLEHIGSTLEQIMEYRLLKKLTSTYIDGLLKILYPDLKIRGTYKVYGTVTGRLASSNPNLQNFPSDKRIKRMFKPEFEDSIFIEFDLSQAEIRGIGSLAHDDRLKKAYDDNLDIHRYIASESLHIAYDKITSEQRGHSKAISFSILYGSSAKSMAKKLGCSIDEAEDLISSFLLKFPKIDRWIKKQHEIVDVQEYVVGLYGRKRRLPLALYPKEEGKRYRMAVNAPVQNLASDFNLIQYLFICNMLREQNLYFNGIYPRGTVHDSILFEVRGVENRQIMLDIYQAANIATNELSADLCSGWINMAYDLKWGKNWADTEAYDPECGFIPADKNKTEDGSIKYEEFEEEEEEEDTYGEYFDNN